MRKLQSLWVALLLLSAGAGAPGAETAPAVDGEKALVAASSEPVLYFPTTWTGEGGRCSWCSTIVDPSQSAPVEVEVYDQQGRPSRGSSVPETDSRFRPGAAGS